MPQRRPVTHLRFPAGGLYKRAGFEDHSASKTYHTVSALNVWPDATSSERERGGSRPGLGDSHTTELGSGDEIRLVSTIQYQDTAFASQTKLMAISNGILYREASATTMSAVTSDLTFATDRLLQATDRAGVLFVADDGSPVASGTDGVIASGGTAFTSASVGSFASAGVDKDDMLLVIVSHTGINEVQTITISGTPTGGTWRARYGGQSTEPLAFDISAANLQTELRALSSIDGAHVAVSGSAGGPYTVTFSGDLGGLDVEMIGVDGTDLTGGTDPDVAVVETTKGSSSTEHSGAWPMSAVVTTTITLADTLRALSGITFRIQRSPKKYTGSSNTLALHLTDDDDDGNPKGFVPVGRPLICLWRDRIVYAGGKYTPHIWEMSRAGDPLDYDYGADPADPSRAIAGSNSEAGALAEPITALIPHNNVCLIFGCSTSLWIARGDPAYGGQIDRLSNEIGVLSAQSWCYSPEDYLYFLSKDGLYIMAPGCGSTPMSISREKLPKELLNIDTSAYTVTMAYDVRYRGVHIFVSKNSAATASHWFVDTKQTMYGDVPNASFWPVTLGSTNYDPFALHARKNYTSDYSWVILGCRDGYLRRYQHNLAADDGTNFSSHVKYGPLRASTNAYSDGMVYDVTGDVAEDSGDIVVTVAVGETPEDAVNNSACATWNWRTPGLQYPQTVRRGGRAYTLTLTGVPGQAWEIESVACTTGDKGRQRKA